MVGQGERNRLLVCQDAWADQGDESQFRFVADVVLEIAVFVFHNSLLVRLFGLVVYVKRRRLFSLRSFQSISVESLVF